MYVAVEVLCVGGGAHICVHGSGAHMELKCVCVHGCGL